MSKAVMTALLCISVGAAADTEFGAEIPREVEEQLFGSLELAQATLYSDLFAAFPPFTVPAGFTVLASADSGVFQRALLKTDLDDAAAIAALVMALTAEGWMEMPARSMAQHTGFITALTRIQNVSLCSDRFGRMGVSITESRGARYAHLSHIVRAPSGGFRRSCTYEANRLAQQARLVP